MSDETTLDEKLARVPTEHDCASEPLGTTPWRVGTKVGRTLYDRNNRLVGIVDTPDIASLVVEAVNGYFGKGVEPPIVAPPGTQAREAGKPTCDVAGCTKGPGHYHEKDGKTYYYPKTWEAEAERTQAREVCPTCPHPPHVGQCNGRNGGTAYRCPCLLDTPREAAK